MNVRPRHDAIVVSLRRNGTSTVDALANEVGASRRTILRDISALRDEGYVIHTDVGRGGGLQLDPQSVQTKAKLSVPEVFADRQFRRRHVPFEDDLCPYSAMQK